MLNKNIKNNFKSRNCLRAERKGRKGWGINPTYIAMAWPQSHHCLLFLLQRQGKTPTLETLARRHPEMISHSVLSPPFRFITLEVLPAGIFAALANTVMVSNLMFPEFLQKCWEDFHGALLSIIWGKEKFADISNKNCEVSLWILMKIQIRKSAIS